MLSQLQQERLNFSPQLPDVLKAIGDVALMHSGKGECLPEIAALFPKTFNQPQLNITKGTQNTHQALKVGVVLSGGQAPGGHNVIAGLFDALKKLNTDSTLIGFCDGPSGIIKNKTIPITEKLLASYRNQGGFDLICSGRTKIETPEDFRAAEATARAHNLDGLVIVGGDDSNTNAALLAEYFMTKGCKTQVIGIPKTIDGDLKNELIEVSFGFDTASKTYSDAVGSIMRDALSAKKYYYFIKLMGRSASHITLECALQTHPNMALIAEEVAAEKMTLAAIVNSICDLISARAAKGKNYGIILIPEGVVEFIPEVQALIQELNSALAEGKEHSTALTALGKEEKIAYICQLLTSPSLACFKNLPAEIQTQLLLTRDSHGNVQVSKIETDRLLIELVKIELKKRAAQGTYQGKFDSQPHFCGYEGRSCLPSNFDSNYCYTLGYVAAALLDGGVTGYICYVKDLSKPVAQWQAGGIPLTKMMGIEMRHGKPKPVIGKALVDLQGKPFLAFKSARDKWALEDDYSYPGPIQFFGPSALTEAITQTLQLES